VGIWVVRERGKVAERWHVVHRAKSYFIADVTEYIAPEE
jgi:hypothetical protein